MAEEKQAKKTRRTRKPAELKVLVLVDKESGDLHPTAFRSLHMKTDTILSEGLFNPRYEVKMLDVK